MRLGRKLLNKNKCGLDNNIAAGSEDRPMLTRLRAGEKAEVSSINAGCKARSRLASLGLIQGAILQVITNPGFGPLLLSIGESRIMVERGVASKVLIRNI